MTGEIRIRAGARGDGATILAMWDRAIAWMVARGQTTQWGSEPASGQTRHRELVRQWERSAGLTIAEASGHSAGASVIVAAPPPHIPPIDRPETYLLFLISDRLHAGAGIGARLVQEAAVTARNRGSEVLRVDCWAGAPRLVGFYEEQGFVRSDEFWVDVRGGWHGQVFEMEL